MDYPPFTDLILVEFTSEKEKDALCAAENCRKFLLACDIEEHSEIFSPKLSYHFKGKNSVRYYILIKSPKGYRNEAEKQLHYGNRCKSVQYILSQIEKMRRKRYGNQKYCN